jgi:hypothetical protein
VVHVKHLLLLLLLLLRRRRRRLLGPLGSAAAVQPLLHLLLRLLFGAERAAGIRCRAGGTATPGTRFRATTLHQIIRGSRPLPHHDHFQPVRARHPV